MTRYFMGMGRAETCGTGTAYVAVAVHMEIEEIESRPGGFILTKSINVNTGEIKYRIMWDGECINTTTSEKMARSLLNDFAPLPRKKKS